MNIVTRDQWNARPPNRAYVNIDWDDRPGLETHHSVGIYGADTAAEFARAVQNDHLGRGWTDVFYNLGLWLDGQIIELRPDHAKSGPIEHLTVCFAGNYDNRNLTDEQKRSWHDVRAYLLGNGGGRDVAWHGQRAQVGCPGDNVIGWLQDGFPNPEETQEDDVLKRGDTGKRVTALQARLTWWRGEDLEWDGQYGPATEAAVKRWQDKVGLDQDGVWTETEWALLLVNALKNGHIGGDGDSGSHKHTFTATVSGETSTT